MTNKPISKQKVFIASLAILLALLIYFPVMASDDDHEDADHKDVDHETARRLQQAGTILPLETIVEKAQAIHPGRILEVELEIKRGQYQYEIEIIDESGHVWEMRFNTQTGQLLKQELED